MRPDGGEAAGAGARFDPCCGARGGLLPGAVNHASPSPPSRRVLRVVRRRRLGASSTAGAEGESSCEVNRRACVPSTSKDCWERTAASRKPLPFGTVTGVCSGAKRRAKRRESHACLRFMASVGGASGQTSGLASGGLFTSGSMAGRSRTRANPSALT